MVLLRNVFLLLLICSGFGFNAASAAPRTLTDSELTEVSAQGLVTLNNVSLNGLDFSTITLNSNISLNANLKNIALGQYGGGTDISIPLLQFGTSAGTTAQQTVQITDPYIQFVYNNAAGAGQNQVIGMRIGFNGISGNVGLLMSDISGSLQLANGSGAPLVSNGYRSTSACAGGVCIPLSQIGGVVAGNASGPSRDFWISMLSQSVQFPGQTGMSQPNVAMAGIWLNWTDRLTAANTTGTVAANMFGQMAHH